MTMLKIRDILLNGIQGVGGRRVLNNTPPLSKVAEKALARKIGESILRIKKSALVTDKGVDYLALKSSQPYREFVENISPSLRTFDLNTLTTQGERLAFWINLYNLLTIDAVIQLGVKNSVTEGWLGVMRFFRRAAYGIDGQRYCLEDIEHGVLRTNKGSIFVPGAHFSEHDPRRGNVIAEFDPRIHFALNCASQSCPPIAYYQAEKIDEQLDLAAANFINTETRLDESGVVLNISRVFKWYQADFGGRKGVLETLLHYLPKKDPRAVLLDSFGYKTMIKYRKYNWNLNAL
jgi:hypothetical protein